MTIEGIPDGWELVRIGKPKVGEYYIDVTGSIYKALDTTPTVLHWYMPIIRKIEKPKRYRPFANAAEFEPHRDRWVRYCDEDYGGLRVAFYDDTHARIDDDFDNWDSHFKDYTFDDGSPFGIEVTE